MNEQISSSPGGLLHIFLIALLVLGVLPSAAMANYWDDFKKAREAVAAKQWQEAEKLLRAAIADTPEAKRRALGARYTPYYYLGIVLQETSDCRGALAAWKTSEKFAIVKPKSEESQDRSRRKARCDQLVNDARKARTDADQAIAQGRAALKGIDRLSRQPTLAPSWKSGRPSFASRRDEAAQILDRAAKRADQGDKALDLSALESAQREVRKAMAEMESISSDAESLLGEASAARNKAGRELDSAVQKAEDQLKAVASLAPYPPQLKRRVAGLQSRLEQIKTQREQVDTAELQSLLNSLESDTRSLRLRAAQPPRALREAAESFLSHDYQATLDRLEQETFDRDRAQFHSSLLQAASYHGLYVLEGTQDPELFNRAKAAIRQCLSIDPESKLGRPGDRLLSPKFLALWQATVDQIAAESASIGDESDEGVDSTTGEPGASVGGGSEASTDLSDSKAQ